MTIKLAVTTPYLSTGTPYASDHKMVATSEGGSTPTTSAAHDEHRCSVACPGIFDDFRFALCLSHDVDRVYKTLQAPYYAIRDRSPRHLRALVTKDAPYWQFDTIMEIEDAHDVRSTFFFLDEKRLFRDVPVRDWLSPASWSRYLGHYELSDPAVAATIRELDASGWEVGLHGSFDSYTDTDRLADEKGTLEAIVGHPITGCRQHYLNLDIPATWHRHRSIGLRYDASFGSSSTFGFDAAHGNDAADGPVGHGVRRPFGDDFIVFPLTVMETPLVESSRDLEDAWASLEGLLQEASERRAVMTVLWHPRLFHEGDFPGYRTLYERLIPAAKDRGGWVGPLEDAYREITRGECFAAT